MLQKKGLERTAPHLHIIFFFLLFPLLFANIFTIFILYEAINPAAPCAEKKLVNNILQFVPASLGHIQNLGAEFVGRSLYSVIAATSYLSAVKKPVPRDTSRCFAKPQRGKLAGPISAHHSGHVTLFTSETLALHLQFFTYFALQSVRAAQISSRQPVRPSGSVRTGTPTTPNK